MFDISAGMHCRLDILFIPNDKNHITYLILTVNDHSNKSSFLRSWFYNYLLVCNVTKKYDFQLEKHLFSMCLIGIR